MPKLEILSQGEEIVTGQVVDTNAAWLAQQSVELGFIVTRQSAVGDKLDDLVNVFREISRRADCCVCTGGLGPTNDDLTAEAFAQAFNRPLLFDESAFSQIQQYFRYRNRPMAECNRKQALLPKSSLRLDNHVGTAPGFAAKAGICWFIFMPGVPTEMKKMFSNVARHFLLRQFTLRPAHLVTIKTIGIGESDLQEKLDKIEMPNRVHLGFRAEPGEVQVKLLFPDDFSTNETEKIANDIVNLIGMPVYAIDGLNGASSNLVSVIDKLMLSYGVNLTLIETVSHGLVASKMSAVNWLTKAEFVNSPAHLFQSYNVSFAPNELISAARLLCQRLQNSAQTDLVLVQLPGIDVNLALNDEKPTFICTGLLVGDSFFCLESTLAGNPMRKQHQASTAIFDLLRRYLQDINLESITI